jgi:hypothetical protein
MDKKDKIHKVMKEFKDGVLKSGSGDKVTSRKQAIAIAMSEAELSKKKKFRGLQEQKSKFMRKIMK